MDYFIKDYGVSATEAVALEDTIMQENQPVSAGSKILKNFIAPFNATVVDRLLDNGYEVGGRAIMDEFGILGLTKNRTDAIAGAVNAVIKGAVSYSLCNDLFGTYRKQAAENGCCYIHPTYGTVSRYGLIPLASSMDQIGIVCKDLTQGYQLLSHIAGKDVKDGAMFPETTYGFPKASKKITIGFPKAIVEKANKGAQRSIQDIIQKFEYTDIRLKHFDLYKQVMYILSSAEISNNISRYDGIKYGYRAQDYRDIDDLYIKTRSQGFGIDAKLTSIMGSMVLSKDLYVSYYEKAMKIRRLIKDSLWSGGYDIIILPSSIGEDPYENLSLYSLANLAGLPSISFRHMGHGVQMLSKVMDENLLLAAWEVCTK